MNIWGEKKLVKINPRKLANSRSELAPYKEWVSELTPAASTESIGKNMQCTTIHGP